MEKIIFWGLIIPILLFVVYLGGRAIMTGFSAKSSNRSSSELQSNDNLENDSKNENLSSELEKLNDLLKSGVLTQEEFEKAKKKILDN
jgi:predicted Zn-dependent peptidase